MLITSLLKNTGERLLKIDIPKEYNSSAPLKFARFANKGTYGDIRYIAWTMPGFCLLYEDILTNGSSFIETVIKGEHFLMTFFYQGNMQIIPDADAKRFDYSSGIIKREYGSVSRLHTCTYAAQRIKRFFLVFSKPYLLNLLQEENWLREDVFFKDLFEGEKDGPDEAHFYLELPIKYILKDFLSERYEKNLRRTFFELKLKELLFRLHTQPGARNVHHHIPDETYQKLVMAKTHLLSNFVSPPTIKQLSRIVSLNEFKLKQYFKMVYGTTIHAYVVGLRMQEAERLMLENWTVNDIALKTGYKSPSHFIAVFKKHFGNTPKQVLRAHDSSPQK